MQKNLITKIVQDTQFETMGLIYIHQFSIGEKMRRERVIIKEFKKLNKLGFEVKDKKFNNASMGNAYVEFESQTTVVQVVIDRSQVLIKIGKYKEHLTEWYEFEDILRFYNPNEKAYEFYEMTDTISWDEAIKLQLERLSKLIMSCEPILTGDFSDGEKIRKIETIRIEEFKRHLYKQNKK